MYKYYNTINFLVATCVEDQSEFPQVKTAVEECLSNV